MGQVYAQIENGVVVNMILWDGVSPCGNQDAFVLASTLPAGVGIGWSDLTGSWVAPAPPPPPTVVTFLQFMALFTSAEQEAIIGSTDINVRVFVVMASGANFLDLTLAEVVNGVEYLASVNLIAATRVAAILSNTAP
jgi:hypothetical protein